MVHPVFHPKNISVFLDVRIWVLENTVCDDISHKAISIISSPTQTNQTFIHVKYENFSKSAESVLPRLSYSTAAGVALGGQEIRDYIPEEELASQFPASQVFLLTHYRSTTSVPSVL